MKDTYGWPASSRSHRSIAPHNDRNNRCSLRDGIGGSGPETAGGRKLPNRDQSLIMNRIYTRDDRKCFQSGFCAEKLVA